MLNESKKLFPHWLDKSDNSNFTKHLKILNHQQKDIRHKLKTIEWSRLLNKPLQIHKIQNEPHKWKMEFEVNVDRLKKVNIYKNPIIVDNEVVSHLNVTNGYFYDGNFYENHSKEITNLLNSTTSDVNNTYQESEINVSDKYINIIEPIENNFYFDLITNTYYKYIDNQFVEEDEKNVIPTTLIHSEYFIDNYSHFFRHIIYEDNSNESSIEKFIVDENNNQKYKTILNQNDIGNNGKYELTVVEDKDNSILYYNISNGKYCIYDEIDGFVEVEDNKIIYVSNASDIIPNDNFYYIFAENDDENIISSRVPLIETEDITPIITNDSYVLEVFTWDDYHFLKGFPEIDFIDYNNNNIIDETEKTYDNLNIKIEKINKDYYLTFRIHQYGIKLIEIFKDDKLIHIADFLIEKLNSGNPSINSNFAYIYNYNTNEVYYPFVKDTNNLEEVILDNDEYVWRLKLSDDDKIFDEKGNWNYELKNKYDLKVTYYDSIHYNDSEYDKVLMKSYVYEDSIFYHDVSLDMIGKIFNVPRYVFRQPNFETFEEKKEFYSKTYPPYCNTLSEDDYHYQRRLIEYINNYNKKYFPVLELWKYFYIDSELVNRKVILSEQNYSYMRTLSAEENKYINELSKNKLDSFYSNNQYISEEEEKNLEKPKIKSIINPDDYINSRNGILVDENNNYIRDKYGTPVRTDYVYSVAIENGVKTYTIEYENTSKTFQWFNAKEKNGFYQIELTESLRIVPNTPYQLRFCVKEYPSDDLILRIIYKNNDGSDIEVVESTPLRKDYDEINEYNEIIYTDYKKEWGVSCEYICTDFLTLENAQRVKIILESKSDFKISDVTLQRITINHFDSEYMRTSTDYNSCVYDLYADYTKIPSNIKYDNLNIFNKVLNRSLPLTKTGYFNFVLEDSDISKNLELTTETNLYIDNLIDVESSTTPQDFAYVNVPNLKGMYEHTYTFRKYIRKGDYVIEFKPYSNNENNIVTNFIIDIKMIVFNEDNSAVEETISFNNFGSDENKEKYFVNKGSERYFKIPFENKSDNSIEIHILSTNPFQFKNFKLIRKSPLTFEEIT